MTSGYIEQGSVSGPYHFLKSWGGANGRFELVNLRYREKWNVYTMTGEEHSKTYPTIHPGNNNWLLNSESPGQFSSYWTSNHTLKLQSKLVSAVREHDFNLAVNAAQGTMTANLIVGNLKKLGRSMLSLKRGNFADAARQLGTSPRTTKLKATDISGRWLELQYGWLPLIGDTYEAFKAYEALTNGPRSLIVRVSSSVPYTRNGSASPSNWSGWGRGRCGMKILYEMSEPMSALRSSGLLDPLSVVWEIIPYSFVIDWFIPIGSYLDNLSVIPSLEGRFCTTQFQVYKNVSEPLTSGPLYNDYKGARSRYRWNQVQRTPSTGLSVAKPGFVPFPLAMKPRRIWNAIALATQIFSSKKPGRRSKDPGLRSDGWTD